MSEDWSERKDHVGDNEHLAVKPPANGGTVDSCKAECLEHSDCVAVSFRPSNPQCKLHTDGVTTQDHSNWNYYIRPSSGPLAAGGSGGAVATALLLLMLCVYIVGGALLGRRSGEGGGGPFISAHPHYRRWLELHGLARDGLAFATGGKQGRAGSGYRAVPDSPGPSAEGQGGSASGGKREKEKKRKRGKSGKRERSPRGREPPPEQPDPAPAPAAAEVVAGAGGAAAGPKTTAAGSGGRWVHVSV